jgi:hypothetical protein
MRFLLIGWVLVPQQFHLLIKPEPAESASRLIQELGLGTFAAGMALAELQALAS